MLVTPEFGVGAKVVGTTIIEGEEPSSKLARVYELISKAAGVFGIRAEYVEQSGYILLTHPELDEGSYKCMVCAELAMSMEKDKNGSVVFVIWECHGETVLPMDLPDNYSMEEADLVASEAVMTVLGHLVGKFMFTGR